MNRLRFTTVMALLLVLSLPIFVFSAPEHGDSGTNEGSGGNKEEIESLQKEISAKKDKVKQIEKSIDSYKKKVEQARLDSVSLKNQIGILDNRKKQVELDIEVTGERIGTAELEIKELTLSIEDATERITNQKELLAELIRTLHFEHGKNYVQILATHDTFSEFYGRVQQLRKVENDLGRQTKSLRLAKDELEGKKTQVEDRKELLEDLQEELEDKNKDLGEQTVAKNVLLEKTKSSEKTYQTLVANLKQQFRQIENEIAVGEQQIRRRLEKLDTLQDIDDDSTLLSWPTQSRYITARFHDPGYPYRNVFEHNAIDIRAAQGTPVRAAASGVVGRAKFCSVASCYAYVMIIHPNKISTVYGHLSQILTPEDTVVARGDIIGYSGAMPGTVGAGPFTTGPHLHFEVRKNGIPVNPLHYLVKDY